MEESPQGEKHLASLVWQRPAAACQPGSSGLWLASALFICYRAHLPLLCQMSGFCTSCFFGLDPTSSGPSLQGLFSKSRKPFQIPPHPQASNPWWANSPRRRDELPLERKVRLKASGVTSGHTSSSEQPGQVKREECREESRGKEEGWRQKSQVDSVEASLT